MKTSAPAEWCLGAETRGGLADRLDCALRLRREAARVAAEPGCVMVSRGQRWAKLFRPASRTPGAEPGPWDAEVSLLPGEVLASDPREALEAVLGWSR